MAEEKKESKTFYKSVATGALYTDRNEAEALSRHWVWAVVIGIVMMVLGAIAIVYPAMTSVSAVIVLGIVLIAAAVAQFIHAINIRGWSGFFWHTLVALTYVVIGILLLVYPLGGLITLTLLLSIYLVLSGVFKIILSVVSRYVGNWGWMLFSGIVAVGLGVIVFLSWPLSTIWFLGLLVGIDLVIGGFSLAALGTKAQDER